MLSQNTKHRAVDFADTYVQPKYNGVRSVLVTGVSGKPIVYSRNRNLYPGYELLEGELHLMDATIRTKYPEYKDVPIYYDAENYTHGKLLQNIAGDSRNADVDKSADTFYLFDVFVPSSPTLRFSQRWRLIEALKPIAVRLPHFQIAPTKHVGSEAEAKTLYTEFKREGYEGAMVRMDAPYEYSYNAHHSDSLLKMKPVEDAEFRIVGYTEGTNGKSKGTLIMICETREHVQFNVTLKDFTIPEAKVKFAEMSTPIGNKTTFEDKYLGRPLIVYYEELSEAGVPLRAKTALEIRHWD